MVSSLTSSPGIASRSFWRARGRRSWRALVAGVVVLCGALVVVKPMLAVALAGIVLLVAVASLPSAIILVGVVLVTALVPYGVQKAIAVDGGSGTRGLLLSDVLLIAGLIRAAPRLLNTPLDRRVRTAGYLVAAFVGLAAVQFARGVAVGRDVSVAGYEFRVLLGFSALLLALDVLVVPAQRALFVKLLPLVGLVAGLWGLTQWVLNVQITASRDAGIVSGVRLTTAGHGHLRGGMFLFPVVVLVALAVVTSGTLRSTRTRRLIGGVLLLNLVCLILTFERSLWVATAVAAAFVIVRAKPTHRLRAVMVGTASLLVVLAAIGTLAPNELSTARERLFSLSQYGTDTSVRYRVAESNHVGHEIRAKPLIGSGLGASIFWGQPWDQVPPSEETYAHNGYLWLAWKLGIPAAALLLGVFFWAIASSRRSAHETVDGVQAGCRAALLYLAIAALTLSVFNELGITATIGALMAFALWRPTDPGDAVGQPTTARTSAAR